MPAPAGVPVVRVGHVVVGDLGVFAPLDVPEVPAALASVVLTTLAAGNVLALAEPLRARSPPRACTLVRRDNFPSLVVRSYRIRQRKSWLYRQSVNSTFSFPSFS